MEKVLLDGKVTVRCAYTDIVKIKKLRDHPGNPNKHNDKQIGLLANIITEQGWRRPIVVSERSGFIVAGHGRLQAARRLALTEVPIDYQQYDSDESEIADLIADNRIAELADLYLPDVKSLIHEIDHGAFDLELTGYSIADIEELMAPASDVTPDETGGGDGGSDLDEGWNSAIETAALLCEAHSEAGGAELADLIREKLLRY